jgi:hypothetical protein
MDFSTQNLLGLLEESKSLKLLPKEERQTFIKKVLTTNEIKQQEVFKILIESKAEIDIAEEKYKKTVADAMDEYAIGVQEMEKKTLNDIRKQAEEKETVKDDTEMSSLLKDLNTL